MRKPSTLEPGPWSGTQESYFYPTSHDSSLPEKIPPSKGWHDLITEASVKVGQLLMAAQMEGWFVGSGFLDVVEPGIKLPMRLWRRIRD